MTEDAYITDQADGENWTFWLGDSAERMAERRTWRHRNSLTRWNPRDR